MKLGNSINFKSSFLSCEKDLQLILKRLFVDSRPYSDYLKRLLVISNKDCLDPNNTAYFELISKMQLSDLVEQQYIRLSPKITFNAHEEIKSYIIVEFNQFLPNPSNPEFRDFYLDFNIICHTDFWELGNYQLRPVKIMGYIDGILNDAKLTGIGTLNFQGASEVVIDDNLSGYLLRYKAVHGSDDLIEVDDF